MEKSESGIPSLLLNELRIERLQRDDDGMKIYRIERHSNKKFKSVGTTFSNLSVLKEVIRFLEYIEREENVKESKEEEEKK